MSKFDLSHNLIALDQVESTNAHLARLLETNKAFPYTVVITAHQTHGKGQRGSSWVSEKNCNLTFSFSFVPKGLKVQRQFYISKITALAIAQFLQDISGLEIAIKWPNDLLINHKKVAGILIENSLKLDEIQSSIVGIGINVNQKQFDRSLANATSLKIETDQSFKLTTCLDLLCQYLGNWIEMLEEEAFELIDEQYLALLYGFQENIEFSGEGQPDFVGKILGVREDGRLTVAILGQDIRDFDIKEIRFKGL